MELELIFENKFAKMHYDTEKSVLKADFQGLVNADLAIESFQEILDVLPKYPLRGGVFNCMEMKGTFTQVNPWLTNVWYPAVIPQGYICWSLATTDVFTRFAGSILINKMTPKGVAAKIFGSLDKAEKWTYNFLEKNQ